MWINTCSCLPALCFCSFHCIVTYSNEIRVAYIESELAKRRLGDTSPQSTPRDDRADSEDDDDDDEASTTDMKFAQRQPASMGKIHEIDLGKDASLRNAERTDLAIRRQKGEIVPVAEAPKKPRKPRLGRDGKPMKPRPRRRRNSDDIKRDQLVEQVLRESKRRSLLFTCQPSIQTGPGSDLLYSGHLRRARGAEEGRRARSR